MFLSYFGLSDTQLIVPWDLQWFSKTDWFRVVFVFAYSVTVLLSGCFLSRLEQYKEIVIARNIGRHVFPQEEVLLDQEGIELKQ